MKRPVVMILLAGALTLSMAAPSVLPAAGNVSVVEAAEKKGTGFLKKNLSPIFIN